jgi:hypothetical protein
MLARFIARYRDDGILRFCETGVADVNGNLYDIARLAHQGNKAALRIIAQVGD